MEYFDNCATTTEAKTRYRELAKMYHPDFHQNADAATIARYTAIMQAINAEYSEVCDSLTRKERPNKSESAYTWHREQNEIVREAIIAALKLARGLDGVTVEVTGFWLWMWGTQPRSAGEQWARLCDELKTNKWRWGNAKKAWFLPLVPSKNRGDAWSMEHIREQYGSTTYRPERENDIVTPD